MIALGGFYMRPTVARIRAAIEQGDDAWTGCTLYRYYNATDKLIYVGISNNPPVRAGQHRKLSWWWLEATRCTLEHFATRAEAMQAEIAAIQAEAPAYNIVHAVS